MVDTITNLEVLSTRAGFNSAVRHIKKTLQILEDLGGNENLGDILFELADSEITGERIGILLRMLLVDKLGYETVSVNLKSVAGDPKALAKEFAKWKAVDMVAAYHHPDLGLIAANPKVGEEIANFGGLRKRELLVIYAGKEDGAGDEQCVRAAELAASLFEGENPKIPPNLYNGKFTVKKTARAAEGEYETESVAAPSARAGQTAAPVSARTSAPQQERVAAPVVTAAAPAITKGPVRMTPMYSVVVQNELFHNGNVEAWKRIISSYNAKYSELQVYIYYEGERILDINSLFKWGKVKHGSAIQFAVAGNEIKDVAKLQRYLVQGASHQFEAFLHGPVSSVLKLFG
jgi:hypothetical protein